MEETVEKKTNRGKQKSHAKAIDCIVSAIPENEPHEELNLDMKVTVRSISDSRTGFKRRADGYGDVSISPKGIARLSRNEIIAQVQNNNSLFCGMDGKGSHASLIIEDAPTRIEVGFEGDGFKQKVFSDELVEELFGIDSMDKFKEKFKESICSRDEKQALMDAINRLKINDYSKIRFAENYTGYRLQGY